MQSMRLDKLLAHLGYGSRKEVAELAKRGAVCINGEICKRADCKIYPEKDMITVAGSAVIYQAHWYLMMHKPAGVVTARQDNLHKTVMDLLPENLPVQNIFPVGRLDKDTEGLLLLTTDGAFDHALMAPGKHVEKTYLAWTAGSIAQDACERFAQGITLADGTRYRPAGLKICGCEDDMTLLEIVLREGKFHQIKRMVREIGGTVMRLKRTAIGALHLDDMLEAGQVRSLTQAEIHLLQNRGAAD